MLHNFQNHPALFFIFSGRNCSSGSLSALSSACTSNPKWCQALVFLAGHSLTPRCLHMISSCNRNKPWNVEKHYSYTVLVLVHLLLLALEIAYWYIIMAVSKDLTKYRDVINSMLVTSANLCQSLDVILMVTADMSLYVEQQRHPHPQ